jgi:hypothetical protein
MVTAPDRDGKKTAAKKITPPSINSLVVLKGIIFYYFIDTPSITTDEYLYNSKKVHIGRQLGVDRASPRNLP